MNWILLAFANAFFDSVSNALGKRGSQKLDVLSAAWSQRFFAIIILFPLALVSKSFEVPDSTFWLALFATSLLNTLTSILFFKAVKDSPLSLTLPVVALTPVFLLITSPLILGEFPNPLGIIGVLSVVVGSYILNLSKRIEGLFGPLLAIFKEKGPRLMLFVALIWSVTSNIDKIAVNHSNPLFFTLLSTSTILIFLTFILLFKKVPILNILLSYKILAPIGFASGISLAFQMTAISMTLVTNVISVKRTSVIFGTIWGSLFYKEESIKERLSGAVIMVIGVIFITLS